MYREFRNSVAFYVVYIEEAHASDMWQLSSNVKDKVVYASPRSYDERKGLASSCVRNLGLEMPALIDDFQNSTERAYTAWPDRLYLIDAEGRVVWKSGPGPFGFDTKTLKAELIRAGK